MKRKYLLLILALGFIISSCRKPNDAESLKDNATAGGYSIVGKYQTIGSAQDVVVKDNYAYIAQNEAGMMIVDISDPKNPTFVSLVDNDHTKVYCRKIAMKGNYVYLSTGSYGISVVDVSNIQEPVVTEWNTQMKPSKNLYIKENFIYAPAAEEGVKYARIDESPGHVMEYGDVDSDGSARGVAITEDDKYMNIANGEKGFAMYNISDIEDNYINPVFVNWIDLPGYAEDVVIDDEKSIAFLACGIEGLQIVDYSDTLNLKIVGSADEGGYAKELMFKDNKIFMCSELAGIQVFDVTDVTNPKLLGEIDTEYALGLDEDEEYIYVADEDEGLIIIKKP